MCYRVASAVQYPGFKQKRRIDKHNIKNILISGFAMDFFDRRKLWQEIDTMEEPMFGF
jgi:hypothetical protein